MFMAETAPLLGTNRRARPRFRRVATALAFGLATTIAVAWVAMYLPTGNAWYGPPTTQALGAAKDDDGKFWQLSRGTNPWHTTVSYWHMQVSGMSLWISSDDYQGIKADFATIPARDQPDDLADLTMQAWYHTTGWPFPALSCSVHWVRQIRNDDIIYAVRGGVQLPRDAAFNPRALPLTPVWYGFLANVALYAGVWTLLTSGRRALRERRRARQGLCPDCRYPQLDLPEGSPCPECGKAPATE